MPTQLTAEHLHTEEMAERVSRRMEEHDEMEAELQMEHEEEVRALQQQNQQLRMKLENLQDHYHELFTEQERRVGLHNIIIR